MHKRPGKNKKGQTLVEYALILALVSILVVVLLGVVGSSIIDIFNIIIDTFAAAGLSGS